MPDTFESLLPEKGFLRDYVEWTRATEPPTSFHNFTAVSILVAALVPMLLGLLVAMPVLFGSLYASYQAIFAVWLDDTQNAPGQAGDNLA